MYIEGNLHGDGPALGRYMMEAKEGERVELAAVRGFSTDDIQAALASEQVLSGQTECEYPFFHAYLRPAPGDRLTDEQYLDGFERYLDRCGLGGQPYVASFHIDEQTGEKHLHGAVSRIGYDDEKEKYFAIDPGLFKVKGCDLARELEEEFDLRRVSSERQYKTPAPTRDEFEEGKRLGTNVREIRDTIRDCLLERSDNGQSFIAALEYERMELAKGDRRDCFVVIDPEGGHHALNKKLTGMTLAETRERLSDIEREQLPTVEQAKELQAERRILETERAAEKTAERPNEPAPLFDRDAAERQWMQQLTEAAIAHDENRQPRADAEAVRQFATPKLGKAAGEIRLAYTLSQSGEEFIDGLEERGLRIACVTQRDVEQNQYARQACAEQGQRPPTELQLGELVVTNRYGSVYFLNQRTTGDRPEEIVQYLGTVTPELPGMLQAREELLRQEEFRPDPAYMEKSIDELRELRTGFRETRRGAREQLQRDDILPGEREMLQATDGAAREGQAQVRHALLQIYMTEPERFAPDKTLQEISREAVQGAWREGADIVADNASFAARAIDAASGLADIGANMVGKLAEGIGFLADSLGGGHSLPTPEVIHARREAREEKEQADIDWKRWKTDDAYHAQIQQQEWQRRIEEAEREYAKKAERELHPNERERER
jgi:hypothetical protein